MIFVHLFYNNDKKNPYDTSSKPTLEPYTCLNKHGMFETYFAEISWELFKRVETINEPMLKAF
jgi:hypothetical protein